MQNLEKEKAWHEQTTFYVDSGHWTSHPLFASRERHWLHNEVQKIRFYGWLYKYIRDKPYFGSAKFLMAPVGGGNDLRFMTGFYSEVHGIDISPKILSECKPSIITREADILQSGYEDQSFDVLACVLFLHHVRRLGFRPFLEEFRRILRPGGVLAIMEPSHLYPFAWAMSMANRIIGNVTGKVDDERPISPALLTRMLRGTGFEKIRMRGLSYSHIRFPVALQLILTMIDYPFRRLWPFKYIAESVGWYCEKP